MAAGTVSSRAILEQVERLVHSPQLQQAESLSRLLRYLVAFTLEHPDQPPKEYQIAVEVFGRSEDFDARLDSAVRVQTGRLRSRLAEYYQTHGAHDPVVIELPKGNYRVEFHERIEPESPPPARPPDAPNRWSTRGFSWAGIVLALALGVALGGVAGVWYQTAKPGRSPKVPAEFRRFWGGFGGGASPPLVIFSNAEFVGRPETGLRYREPGSPAANGPVADFYTGVGEVLGIAELDRVFASMGESLVVKRARLLTWDQTKNRDLVFIGSPSENLGLRDLPIQQDFVFQKVEAPHPRKGDLAIVNLRPKANELPFYLASPEPPITEDHALIELRPGLSDGQEILLLAGTTTFGTQAAVEFVCRAEQLRELLSRQPRTGAPQPFAAVIRVRVNGGVPVESRIVAYHALSRQ